MIPESFLSDYEALRSVIARECKILVSRPIYLFGIIIVPLICYITFLSLMHNGLPQKIPTGIVDLDHTASSRNFIRNLNALDLVDITIQANSFTEAKKVMQKGDIYGFLIIPENFEAKAMSGRQPEISYYTNSAYYIPSSLLFKSFKTMSILASGKIVMQTKLAKGEYDYQIMPQLQPINYDVMALGNPWLNYSVYLNNNLLPGMLQLMVMLMTVFSIGQEVKMRKSRAWIEKANNSIIIAITGKLLPQTILFIFMGIFCQIIMFGYMHFPHANGFLPMAVAMAMLIVASQSLGVIIMSIVPSLRIGLSAAGLIGILSISLAGFTFPTLAMYVPFRLFSELIPIRHYFLIYADQALNGAPLYYSIMQYLYLFLFFAASFPLLKRLKLAMLRQIYVP
ncbi:MAG: ABC transporter permease [Bacteroidales bacterium]